MGLLSRSLGRIAHFSAGHPKAILGSALIVTLASVLLLLRLEVQTNLRALVPEDLKAVREHRNLIEDFGRGQFLLVVVETPPDIPLRKYAPYIRRLKKELKAPTPRSRERLEVSRGDLKKIGAYLREHGLLLLDPAHLDSLNALLDPQSIERTLAKYGFFRSIPWGGRFDPLGIIPFIKESFLPFESIDLDPNGEFFFFKDKDTAFFFTGTGATAGHTRKTKEFLKRARQVEKEVWHRFSPPPKWYRAKSKAAKLAPPVISYTGMPIFLLENKEILTRTLIVNLSLTLLGIALLFYLFFRSLRSLLLAYIPLSLGLLFSFGFASLTVGSLNILTIGVGGILIGLGIDFPSYLLNRFYRRREEGQNLREALVATWTDTGSSVFFGALTTSAAFFLMTAAKFQAFRELGLIAGSGILFTLLSVLILLPALITWIDPKLRGKAIRKYPEGFILFPIKKPRATLVTCLVLFFGFGIFLTQFRLTSPLQEAHQAFAALDSPSVNTFEKISAHLGANLLAFPMMVQQDTLQAALEINEQLARQLGAYRQQGFIAAYDTLARWLPSEARQEQSLDKLQNYPNLNPDQFTKNYTVAMPSLRFKTLSGHDKYRESIAKALAHPQKTDLKKLQALAPGDFLDHYIKTGKDSTKITTYIYLPADLDYPTAKEEFLEELQESKLYRSGKVSHPSEENILNDLKKMMMKDLLWLGIAVFLAIFTILWIFFRSLKMTLLGLTPVILGGLGALGSYTLLVGPFSLVNFLWIPIYIGLAIDDVIHLGNHLLKPDGTLAGALRKTGGAIVFTSLATMVGFGSLGLVEVPMIQKAGIFIVLAMGWELLASLFLFPALLDFFKIKSKMG